MIAINNIGSKQKINKKCIKNRKTPKPKKKTFIQYLAIAYKCERALIKILDIFFNRLFYITKF